MINFDAPSINASHGAWWRTCGPLRKSSGVVEHPLKSGNVCYFFSSKNLCVLCSPYAIVVVPLNMVHVLVINGSV